MHVRLPLEPMLARSVDRLPGPQSGPGDLRWEPKYDGFRAIAAVDDNGGVALYSRRGARLDQAFPEIIGALFGQLSRGTVLDGEVVRWVGGRLDFQAVQDRYRARGNSRELAATSPAHVICFDVLEARGEDLRDRPLTRRRATLEGLFRGVPATSPLALGMQTDDYDTAMDWFHDLRAAGIEGLIAKPATSRYLEGRRDTWQKIKAFATTDAIVGGITGTLQRPVELILGRYDSTTDQLRMAGRSTRIDDHTAAQLAAVLQPAGPDHPWPEQLPATWGGRGPGPYTRVEPTAVVEIRADPATAAGRWRHKQRIHRLRAIDPREVPLDLDLD